MFNGINLPKYCQIEQSIKFKVEYKGVILKKWDISIFRGILTGYNEAFIISTDKRNEILSKCRDEIEREKTEVLIRPILRGRDILRFGYNWGDNWLIATFPSKGYNIEDYPTLKQFLLSFGIERLEQTGEKSVVNGQIVKARKRTNNKWFETQDSINYWDEFLKPKIIYPNMTKYMPFVYDESGAYTNQKCFIVTGEHIAFLTAFFNSSLFKYCFRDAFPELLGGTRELSKIFFDKIPVIKVSDEQDEIFKILVGDIQTKYTVEKHIAIDKLIFTVYGLSQEEQDTIGYIQF